MKAVRRLLTLDSNVFIATLKANEPYSERCAEIIGKVADNFLLSEPSIISRGLWNFSEKSRR